MSNNYSAVVHIRVGRSASDAKAYGRYRFATMPRVGEEIHIDLEQGDGSSNGLALKVNRVSHFPVSLEAPMGPIPTSDSEYTIILCSEN